MLFVVARIANFPRLFRACLFCRAFTLPPLISHPSFFFFMTSNHRFFFYSHTYIYRRRRPMMVFFSYHCARVSSARSTSYCNVLMKHEQRERSTIQTNFFSSLFSQAITIISWKLLQ